MNKFIFLWVIISIKINNIYSIEDKNTIECNQLMESIQNCHKDEEKDIEINVFIHGTADGIHAYVRDGDQPTFKGLFNHLNAKRIGSFSKQYNEKLYQNYHDFASFKNRKKNILKENFPMIMGIYPGLSQIINYFGDSDAKDIVTNCIAEKAYTLIFLPFKDQLDRTNKSNNQKYYMFNWVGNLSDYDRHLAAEKLVNDVIDLKKIYPKNLQINFYAHSHGGNMLLEALFLARNNLKVDLSIKNIYCLGMPIGKKTNYWIKEICFDHLYNFYSNDDIVQTADVSFGGLHTLRNRMVKKISNKIMNIEVKRLDTQKLYHGLFYMYNNLRSKTIMKPVISDIPYFLSLMVNLEDTLKEKKIKEIQTDEYVYSFD